MFEYEYMYVCHTHTHTHGNTSSIGWNSMPIDDLWLYRLSAVFITESSFRYNSVRVFIRLKLICDEQHVRPGLLISPSLQFSLHIHVPQVQSIQKVNKHVAAVPKFYMPCDSDDLKLPSQGSPARCTSLAYSLQHGWNDSFVWRATWYSLHIHIKSRKTTLHDFQDHNSFLPLNVKSLIKYW